MIKWLLNREIKLNYPSFTSIDLCGGLRSYSLRQILPEDAHEDIFLGFSINGCFLISYVADYKHHVIRFWNFPPDVPSNSGFKLSLYSRRTFLRMNYSSRLHDTPCVRFIQCQTIPESYTFLACDNDGTGLVTAFGVMPDPDCISCAHRSFYPNHISGSGGFECPIHSHVLLLNLDLPVIHENVCSQPNLSSFDVNSSHTDNSLRHSSKFVPPCIKGQIFGFNDENTVDSIHQCSCFALTSSSIGRVQVGICPHTGRIRLAWASPDAQVKVISCLFVMKENDNNSYSKYVLPQGTCNWLNEVPCSLAFMPPLLTHNYCSTCYSWPDHSECRKNKPKDITIRLQSCHNWKECLFTHIPSSVELISDSSAWPDNHTNSAKTTGLDFVHHECCMKLPAAHLLSKFRTRNHKLENALNPSLLYKRPSLTVCKQLTYLAMVNDIRASYVHWSLISRLTNPSTQFIRNDIPTSNPNILQWPNSISEDSFELNLDNSNSSLDTLTDYDPVAIMTSPISVDRTTSPEDLLAHRLSGQCHTSFDLSGWEEYFDPSLSQSVENSSNNNNINNNSVSTNGTSVFGNGRIIVHIEEVVFDMPVNNADNIQPSCNQSTPTLSVFVPPSEPDLLLVYLVQDKITRSTCRRSFEEVSLHTVIDLSTGLRYPINDQTYNNKTAVDCPLPDDNFGVSASLLENLTTYCPHTVNTRSSLVMNRLHELNNCLMACRLDSLKLLVDPQGGYSVYL